MPARPQRIYVGEIVWLPVQHVLSPQTNTTIYRNLDEAIVDIKEDFLRILEQTTDKLQLSPEIFRPENVELMGQDFITAVWNKLESYKETKWRPQQFGLDQQFRATVYEMEWHEEEQVYRCSSSCSHPVYRLPRQAISTKWRDFIGEWQMTGYLPEEEFQSRNPLSVPHDVTVCQDSAAEWPRQYWMASATYIQPTWETVVERNVCVSPSKQVAIDTCGKLAERSLLECFLPLVDVNEEVNDVQPFFQNISMWDASALTSLWNTASSITDDRFDGTGIQAHVLLLHWDQSLHTYPEFRIPEKYPVVVLPAASEDHGAESVQKLVATWSARNPVVKRLDALAASAYATAPKRQKTIQIPVYPLCGLYLSQVIWTDPAVEDPPTLKIYRTLHLASEGAKESCRANFMRVLRENAKDSSVLDSKDVTAIDHEFTTWFWHGQQDNSEEDIGGEAKEDGPIRGFVHELHCAGHHYKSPRPLPRMLTDQVASSVYHLPQRSHAEIPSDTLTEASSPHVFYDLYIAESLSVSTRNAAVGTTTTVTQSIDQARTECTNQLNSMLDRARGRPRSRSLDQVCDDLTIRGDLLYDVGGEGFRAQIVKMSWCQTENCFLPTTVFEYELKLQSDVRGSERVVSAIKRKQ